MTIAGEYEFTEGYLYQRWKDLRRLGRIPQAPRTVHMRNGAAPRSPHDRITQARASPSEGCYSKADLPQPGDGYDGRPLPYNLDAFEIDPLLARLIDVHHAPRTDLPAFMVSGTVGG